MRYDVAMKTSVEQRFWAKVDTSGECWLWTACVVPGGYGQFVLTGTTKVLAHRFAYELMVGPVPEGMMLDHQVTCPKGCVNPAHLRPVTRKQNLENRTGAQRNSKSGVLGVMWVGGRMQKWRGMVRHNGNFHHVGYFDVLDDAAEAVRLKRIELFTHNDLDRVT